jgi:hypothetical protein
MNNKWDYIMLNIKVIVITMMCAGLIMALLIWNAWYEGYL